jgi:hypothetical protein
MKDLARGNTHVKYESPTTYKSKVMTKVKSFGKEGQTQRSGGHGTNERSCQKEYTCEI